jgi:hypothetical protein
MIFSVASGFPSVKDYGNVVAFSLMIFNEGADQLISLFFEVLMLDPYQIITIDDDRGNGKPP